MSNFFTSQLDAKALLKSNDLTALKEVLQNNPSLRQHWRNPKSRTLLHIAAIENQLELVRELLAYSLDLEAVDIFSHTALHYAVIAGDLRIVEALIQHGANIECRNDASETVLHLAAKNGCPLIFDALLKQGISPVLLDAKQQTPIHTAVIANDLQIVEILLKSSINTIEFRDIYTRTPLHWAAKYNHFQIANRLIEQHADIEAITDQGHTPLHLAVQNEALEVIELLLQYQANQQAIDVCNYKPLHYAIIQGFTNSIACLTQQQNNFVADLEFVADFQTVEGTLLHLAIKYAQPDMVGYLLHQYRFLWDQSNTNNELPLTFAIKCLQDKASRNKHLCSQVIFMLCFYQYRFGNAIEKLCISKNLHQKIQKKLRVCYTHYAAIQRMQHDFNLDQYHFDSIGLWYSKPFLLELFCQFKPEIWFKIILIPMHLYKPRTSNIHQGIFKLPKEIIDIIQTHLIKEYMQDSASYKAKSQVFCMDISHHAVCMVKKNEVSRWIEQVPCFLKTLKNTEPKSHPFDEIKKYLRYICPTLYPALKDSSNTVSRMMEASFESKRNTLNAK